MNYTRYLLPALLSTLLTCNNDVDKADAYGNFEAIEVVVSAETQGRIMTFEPHEGEKLGKEQVIVVDYKFGQKRSPGHLTQVRKYADMLRQMEYRDVSGFIWYVNQNEVVEV